MRQDAKVSKGWEDRGSLVSPPRVPLALLLAVKFPLPLSFFFACHASKELFIVSTKTNPLQNVCNSIVYLS